MTFLEELRAVRETPAAAWHQFVLDYRPDDNSFYFFVEGRLDVSFYVTSFERLYGDGVVVHGYRCGGKNGVLDARRKVRNPQVDYLHCLFFVDKDLSDILGEPNPSSEDTFCTDTYSIENYFVTKTALSVVWNQLWGLNDNHPHWPTVQQQFTDTLSRFHRIMAPLMAWIVISRQNAKRLNLNNVELAQLLEFDDDLMPRRRPGSTRQLESSTGCSLEGKTIELLRECRRLRNIEPKKFLRGKFELWFFAKFIRSVFEFGRTWQHKPSGEVSPTSTPEGIAITLCGKLPIPTTLQDFLIRQANQVMQ